MAIVVMCMFLLLVEIRRFLNSLHDIKRNLVLRAAQYTNVFEFHCKFTLVFAVD